MGTLLEGARQALFVCLGLKKNEKITIITDLETLKVGKTFHDVARKVTPNINVFVLEDFGKRPLQQLPQEIASEVKESDVVLFAAKKIGNEVYTIRRPLRHLASHARFASMPGVNEKVMETGMCTDHKKIWKFSKKVYNLLSCAKEILVKTPAGTNLEVELNKRFKWMNSDGDLRRGSPCVNLPGAEIWTYPAKIEGIAVIDGILGDYFSERYGLLDDNPVILRIENGSVISVECENPKLEKDLNAYLSSDKNGKRIGEFALGTNPFLKDFIGICLQDEKLPTVHIAMGNPYPELTGAEYTSKIHVDGVMRNASVWVDGKLILSKGKYRL
ncbi:MAG: hypothetical protein DRP15_01025 [Candidatus Aenigmatarchaeota archaeon]|nr:MAG: hypothetical protein DRP15_01025 [Candidatus Aenigmarchaeota archaeon]